MNNNSIEYWEERLRNLYNNPLDEIKKYVNEAIQILYEKLTNEKEYSTILSIQAEIKALKGIIDLPMKLKTIYEHNLQVAKKQYELEVSRKTTSKEG